MTIKDLAEKTGYSVATISRVLNNQPNVSEKAREEIRKLVEECGYQINVNAKQLKQHANSILVVVKGTPNQCGSNCDDCRANHCTNCKCVHTKNEKRRGRRDICLLR